jgi:uncharacterized protein YmfQ (DUF2313 family)
LLALLPAGRAWQNHFSIYAKTPGGELAQFPTFQIGQTGLGATPDEGTLTVLQQFWAGYAEVLEYLHQRACALIQEFFCTTLFETTDLWAIEWGFPDPCLPYDALCEKVTAQGGATCAYFQEIALKRGWLITCSSVAAYPPEMAVQIDLDNSPAYEPPGIGNLAGAMVSGIECNACHDPSTAPIICLIERIKPAHVRAVYHTVGQMMPKRFNDPDVFFTPTVTQS